MSVIRQVVQVSESIPTVEGAGVKLMRAFARPDSNLDPFLLLDDFGSDSPEDYLAGFPWHPHRGIETITYMLSGRVKHADSLGNEGEIGPGDVQWMTAGSGIVHEEMPLESKALRGFQLWANLPAADKMCEPKYRDVKAADIPSVRLMDGVEAKVICGSAGGVSGPVREISTAPQYLDVTMTPGKVLAYPVPLGHNVFAYVFEGGGRFDDGVQPPCGERRLVVLGGGEEMLVSAGESGLRFLLVSGAPLQEPVAWGGPIVMNTKEELATAFEEYRSGAFIKHKK
jgi:redox-sensitive bicupin YhaK (pirin superfamily)